MDKQDKKSKAKSQEDKEIAVLLKKHRRRQRELYGIKPGTRCQRCKKRPAKMLFNGNGALGISHSWSLERICRQCCVEEFRKTIENCEEGIKHQTKLIEREKKHPRRKSRP